MLVLVATPIGNLADLSFRAIETLKACAYILCEDTRHSRHLLSHYAIQTPLRSYHRFNEATRQEPILQDLKAGQTIALISDAGTPGIADPGERLVKACRTHQIPVTMIPGPCAAIHALACSGFPTARFQFLGFLPKKSVGLKNTLQEILSYCGTTVCYESPYRILKTVQALAALAPERRLAIARELTKKFEEFLCGSAQELAAQLPTRSLKGEFVLVIDSPDV